jgi:hypothetical protein
VGRMREICQGPTAEKGLYSETIQGIATQS